MKARPSGPLAGWYARPLSPEEASALLETAERREQRLLRRGGRCRVCALMTLVARHWLGHSTAASLEAVRHRLAGTAHGRALAELIAGQLLTASRRAGGAARLQRGFRRAAHLFTAADYLRVIERHRLLTVLPAADGPAAAEDLPALLRTAQVVTRLQGAHPVPRRVVPDRTDLYG